ncbi:MAG: translational GTPase TypA [Chlamydiae bacterium]|nr:translational GTPase TypA [Chlamydiota bacterium]
MHSPEKIRNIAIIAHIDHGKTTMLDAVLKQSNVFRDNEKTAERMMDSHDQEKERGITIYAKHTSIDYGDYKINIIDTPGHADFSGEVERILGMVNSVLLLVDAQEGPMPQTRFVLSKSLQKGLKPIVVINKIDRPHADPDRVLNLTFDLFAELGATDDQLDFRFCYASGLSGFALKNIDDPRIDMKPLFDLIVEAVPAPPGRLEDPFLMQVATVGYDEFLGRLACGRILNGSIKKGDTVIQVTDKEQRWKITKIQGWLGIQKIEIEEAGCGDIVGIFGVPEIMIGDTLCSSEKIMRLPPIILEEPTVSIDIMVNNSPFVGNDGQHITMNKLRERLLQEKKANISLRIEEAGSDAITVSGRGELHLSVLVETMRREGYEMTLSKPRVIMKEEKGQKLEPVERVHIEVPSNYSGAVIEEMSRRKGEMQALDTNEHGLAHIEFLVPTRGLMGYRSKFLTMTRGLGVLTSIFERFEPFKGPIPGRAKGVAIAASDGRSNGYGCFNLQERTTLFVSPGDEVYEGMVVGENTRDNDLVVNVTKAKQLTNVRSSGNDENIILTPPRKFTLEQAIDYIEDDEQIEVTPSFIRMRKRHLKEGDRKRKN